MAMHLQVVTPRGAKVDARATQVTAPGELGDLGILPGHRPLLSVVGIGLLSYDRASGGRGWLAVNGGYLEVAGPDVIVITETAETPEEIDVERANEALQRATEALRVVDTSRTGEVARLSAAKRRAENRLAAARLVKPEIPR